jgi:hypothetical protein
MKEGEASRLRVLVLTNHFRSFEGSELVALQTAQWFADQGDAVTLAANLVGPPVTEHAGGVRITNGVLDEDISAYDLIWHQHDLLSLFPMSTLERAARIAAPHVASVSLSPYEPYEHVNGLLARALSADVYANSPETADDVVERNGGVIARGDVRVFHNAAPSAFFDRKVSTPGEGLKSILFVSNHPPSEISECAERLAVSGVDVRRIGFRWESVLLQPEDIAAVDAVVSIGKSVSYAIASGKPVFVYDHFGGDGWLTRANFAQNLRYNFSGRPGRRKVDAETLIAEIVEGYAAAVSEMCKLVSFTDLGAFQLDACLAPLRKRAMTRNVSWRRLKLGYWLRQPWFRAHLAACRRKSEIMRTLRYQ